MGRQARETDPGASPLACFGAELQAWREARGLHQKDIAAATNYSIAQVSQIEAATRKPTVLFAKQVDELLDTPGTFSRLILMIVGESTTLWFKDFVAMEEAASRIQVFETSMVPGLLQTEAYMRAIFGAANNSAVDELTEARLARQKILRRPAPPTYWAILDESILRRPVGSPEVWREQLAHLLAAAGDHVTLQVLPFDVGAYALMATVMNLFTFHGREDVGYIRGTADGSCDDGNHRP